MNSPQAFERTRIWHLRFMAMAYHISKWSKDPNCKIGAVLVSPDRRSIAVGYNGFPRRFGDTEARLNDPDTKNLFMVHAERNALDNARFGMRGTTLYSTRFPCLDCMKGIIQTGVEQVVAPHPDFDHHRWGESHKHSMDLMKEANLKYYRMDSVLSDDYEPPEAFNRVLVSQMLRATSEMTIGGHFDEVQSLLNDIRIELGIEPCD